MRKVTVNASRKYDCLIQRGLLNKSGELISKIINPCKIAIITDSTVDALYSNKLTQSLQNSNYEVFKFVFRAGEASKSMDVLEEILEFLAENEFTRTDLIVALGGGVTGDLAGFVAAVFLRGIEFVQIPTTLLAAVDSSVGGKTAVDLKGGKNLAGAFHQPSLVICDPDVFKTLSDDEFRNGLAEAIKYGVIGNQALFDKLATGRFKSVTTDNMDELEEIIEICIKMKRDIVSEDEFDTGARQLLNLGHTLGHSIEKESNFSLSHGNCVAIGMYLIANYCEQEGICVIGTTQKIKTALINNELPYKSDLPASTISKGTLNDKKRRKDTISFIFIKEIGKCIIKPVNVSEVNALVSKAVQEL